MSISLCCSILLHFIIFVYVFALCYFIVFYYFCLCPFNSPKSASFKENHLMTMARDALRTMSIFRFRSLTNNINFLNELIYKDWSKLFVRVIRNTHPCVTRYVGYTVCTTWLRLFLHEPNKNCDQFLNILLYITKCNTYMYT
jgi:hypothetical protein